MEEGEYKSTYDEITRIPCGFEKALTNNQCRCSYSRHFWLADREGYACKSADASSQCSRLLSILRDRSRFSLKLASVGSSLPHNQEIRVQVGGLTGLKRVYGDNEQTGIEDVRQLVEAAYSSAGSLEQMDFTAIVQSVAEYKVRSRRKSRST